jgi:hypothetical protein
MFNGNRDGGKTKKELSNSHTVGEQGRMLKN